MTPEQEISGLKRLCESWRKDCQRYAEGLREVRKQAVQFYDVSDFESNNWLELIDKINRVLSHDDDCPTCGEDHGGEVPLACETGDGE